MSKSLKPGVVTGEDYKILLQNAKEGGYAYPPSLAFCKSIL